MTKLHIRRFFIWNYERYKELRLDTAENNYYTIALCHAINTENLNGEDGGWHYNGDIITARK